MRVLVSGNLGYVGTVLTPLLQAAGHEVWGYDTGFYEDCFLGEPGESGVDRQIAGDIRHVESRELSGVEAVIHLAALSNDPTGELNPQLTDEINFRGSMRLAEAAKRSGASRFLFASSCSIYGHGDGALTESAPFHPLTAYAVSKVRTEEGLRAMADDEFSPVYLRNATAYGLSPRMRFDVAVNNLTGWAITTGQVRLMSDGRAWRSFVHVEDMARAFVTALAVPRERLHDQALNVGREEDNMRILDLAEGVALLVPDCVVSFAEGVTSDARNYHVSFEKLRSLLPEFAPRWDVPNGIRQLRDAFTRIGLTYAQFDGRAFTRLKQLQHLMAGGRLDADLTWKALRPA